MDQRNYFWALKSKPTNNPWGYFYTEQKVWMFPCYNLENKHIKKQTLNLLNIWYKPLR